MIGFRILPRRRKVDAATAERFRPLPVANISDVMARMTHGGARLRPMHSGGVMCGPAFTVKTRPGDNLMVHKAIDICDPGDIVVVDAGGDLTNAIIGELMLAHMVYRKLGGIVIDGAIRDYAAIRAQGFPVYAAGITHRGPYKDGPGEINVPVALDGMVIAPGDLVIGDEDGLLAIAYDDVETVYRDAKAKHEAEEKQMAAIPAGRGDRSWVDAALQRGGCADLTGRK